MNREHKKKALRMFSYGLYILTAQFEGELAAATVTWLSQASFEPPLVMVAVRKDSNSYRLLDRSKHFAINILGEGQKEMAGAFFRTSVIADGRMNGYVYEQGKTGCPIFLEAPASVECRVTDVVDRGDHAVVVGEVVQAAVRHKVNPLQLDTTGWSYGG